MLKTCCKRSPPCSCSLASLGAQRKPLIQTIQWLSKWLRAGQAAACKCLYCCTAACLGVCPASAGAAWHSYGTELLHTAGTVEVTGSAWITGKHSLETRSWILSFLAKTRPERIKPGSLVGCPKGQCIQFSLTVHGSRDGFVLLRSSCAVAFAEGPAPKVSFSSCKNCTNCLGGKKPKASHELLDVLCSFPSIWPAVNTMSLAHP